MQSVVFEEWANVQVEGTVVSAMWGLPDRAQLDVTSIVAKLLARGSEFEVTSKTMGDPCPGDLKRLQLVGNLKIIKGTDVTQDSESDSDKVDNDAEDHVQRVEFEEWDDVEVQGTVDSAMWGLPRKAQLDVTSVVKELIATGSEFEVTTETMGDPCPSDLKRLHIVGDLKILKADYYVGKYVQSVEFKEWADVQVEGTVDSALWGRPDRAQMDVTSVVAELIAAGAEFEVTNETMGGDPCPGDLKRLQIFGDLKILKGTAMTQSSEKNRSDSDSVDNDDEMSRTPTGASDEAK